jgi:hypothetical protein
VVQCGVGNQMRSYRCFTLLRLLRFVSLETWVSVLAFSCYAKNIYIYNFQIDCNKYFLGSVLFDLKSFSLCSVNGQMRKIFMRDGIMGEKQRDFKIFSIHE